MNFLKYIMAFFGIGVGLYPSLYFLVDMSDGLLASKPEKLLQDVAWETLFYTHIALGGLALMVGWSQFFESLRKKYLETHRKIGVIYCLSVWISGIAGLYIAGYATGGLVSVLGFSMLAILWLFTTTKGFLAIKQRNIIDHQKWMVRSYALCFAAVTLRLWLPLMTAILGLDFIDAYLIVSWLCWIPNIFVAELIIRNTSFD